MIDFVPLPSDPKDLTSEHAALVFRGDLDGVLSDILALGYRAASQQPAPQPERAAS